MVVLLPVTSKRVLAPTELISVPASHSMLLPAPNANVPEETRKTPTGSLVGTPVAKQELIAAVLSALPEGSALKSATGSHHAPMRLPNVELSPPARVLIKAFEAFAPAMVPPVMITFAKLVGGISCPANAAVRTSKRATLREILS